jgi:hypothetical protein
VSGTIRQPMRRSSRSDRAQPRAAYLSSKGSPPSEGIHGTRDNALRKNNPGYGPERFTYQPESNTYRCPAGEQLNYAGLNVRNRAHAYIGSAKRCGACSQKTQCTTGRYKYLAIHMHESVRQRAQELAQTPEFAKAQRQRTQPSGTNSGLLRFERDSAPSDGIRFATAIVVGWMKWVPPSLCRKN